MVHEPKYTWNGTLSKRKVTTYLILHHAAGYGSAESIHAYHKSLGWLGIAYHYYVRLDGTIYRGRPENVSGGHTTNYNYCSIGICAEGNFQVDTMPEAQRAALAWLVADIRTRYPGIAVKKHSAFQNTSCPGANYPFESIVSGVLQPASVDRADTLKAYQSCLNAAYKAGLAVDGIWGGKTRDAVRMLQRGDRGEAVRILQTMLLSRGFDCKGIDGVFGSNTYNAVAAFQKSAGIAVDGLAGKNTFEKLFAA